MMFQILGKDVLTNRLSEATESLAFPQAEAWGFVTMTALRAEYYLKNGTLTEHLIVNQR